MADNIKRIAYDPRFNQLIMNDFDNVALSDIIIDGMYIVQPDFYFNYNNNLYIVPLFCV